VSNRIKRLKADDLPHLDIQDIETYKHVTVGGEVAMLTPTKKQIAYVNALIETGSSLKAYEAAGYGSISHYSKTTQYKKTCTMNRVPIIRNLVQLAMLKWCQTRNVNRESLAEKALQTYEKADNVKDQIAALNLVARLSGLT
jgi:hypothetical protein